MTATEFAKWAARMRERHGWTKSECARRLGCARNQVTIWGAGKGAPLYIDYACRWLELHSDDDLAEVERGLTAKREVSDRGGQAADRRV